MLTLCIMSGPRCVSVSAVHRRWWCGRDGVMCGISSYIHARQGGSARRDGTEYGSCANVLFASCPVDLLTASPRGIYKKAKESLSYAAPVVYTVCPTRTLREELEGGNVS